MRILTVSQEEIMVTRAYNYTLKTTGVSTCICIAAKGRIDNKPYLAMHHWDGFPCDFDKSSKTVLQDAKSIIFHLFEKFSNTIVNDMASADIDIDILPSLEQLYLIGGERATENISGTELEVAALEKYVKRACARHFYLLEQTKYIHQHFLTKDSSSLTVSLSKDAIEIVNDALSHETMKSNLERNPAF